jgi:hypothetical protein
MDRHAKIRQVEEWNRAGAFGEGSVMVGVGGWHREEQGDVAWHAMGWKERE